MSTKIPATIVTGFLGAGKTSLVRHLVENARGKRLALLINEFGDLGVDRAILGGCGIADCAEADVIELANGCICCTVADDFLPAMRTILARDPAPDHIVIETSGLALPKPLVAAFNWPEVRNRLTVDGVLVVADAAAVLAGRFAHDPDAVQEARAADAALDHETPLEELFEEQLGCGDLVLVNKADQVGSEDRAAVERLVRAELRPGVRLVWTSHGKVDPAVALGLGVGAEGDLANRPSHHDGGEEHGHDEFESFVLAVPPVADPEPLAARLRAAIRDHDILRVKGFLAVAGKPLRHVVQAVGERVDRYYDRPWRPGEAEAGELVVIGLKGLDRDAIAAAVLAPVAA
jgi:cobalamin biosynthesis protein CobW